jgi:hypothetical protein
MPDVPKRTLSYGELQDNLSRQDRFYKPLKERVSDMKPCKVCKHIHPKTAPCI